MYFHSPLNVEGYKDIVSGKLKHLEVRRDFGYYGWIRVEEVFEATHRMHSHRVIGLEEISIEFWKYLGEDGWKWLTGLFNRIFKFGKTPGA